MQLDGTLHPDFISVARVFRSVLGGYPGGGAVCVYHQGVKVVDLWGGARDATGRPWRQDTIAPSFSTTKGVASTLVHMMADRGLIDYETPVAEYWPEFAQRGKDAITVRHVMAHQSGLYHIRDMIDQADRMLDWPHMVHAIEAAQPKHPPGARTGYHGLTYGFLVGELLQRVTGRRFSDLVREELAEPLGLDGFFVGAPNEALSRAAQLVWPPSLVPGGRFNLPPDDGAFGDVALGAARGIQGALRIVGVRLHLVSLLEALAPKGIQGFDFGAADTLRAAIPAANGMFTARSLARMYAALAGGGAIDDVRLVSPRTLALANEVQDEAPRRVVIPWNMRWRLGYHGIFTTHGVPQRAFGHFGFGGSGGFADPNRELAVSLIVNGGIGTPLGDLRIVRIGGAALEGVERRRQGRRSLGASIERWLRGFAMARSL